MSKIWKLLVVALVITTSTFGQHSGGHGGGRGGQQGPPELPTAEEIRTMVNDLSSELLLSEEQEEQISELYTSHFKDVDDKTSSGRPNRSEMKEMKEDFENDVKDVLTKDQQKLYTTYLKNKS